MFSFRIESVRSSDDLTNGAVFLIGPGSKIKPIFNIASTSTRNYSAGRSVLRNCFRATDKYDFGLTGGNKKNAFPLGLFFYCV